MKRRLFGALLICLQGVFLLSSGPAAAADYDIDTDFRPVRDGFSFENYGNEICKDESCDQTEISINLSASEMRRMFGSQVCRKILPGDECLLYKEAETWMNNVNQEMDQGHCEGMAVLSSLFYADVLNPKMFGADTVSELTLKDNPELQQEIAYWYATQWFMDDYLIENDPITQLKILISELKDNPKLLVPVGIYQNGTDFGHTLVAYAISDRGNGVYWVMVYDSNFPNEERHLTIDVSDNSWQYQSLSFPEKKVITYEGSGQKNPLQLAPINSRFGHYPCNFCPVETVIQDSDPEQTEQAFGMNQIIVDTGVNLFIENEAGQRSGFDWENGAVLNQIPEANIRKTPDMTSAVLPRDMSFFLWMNDPNNRDWKTFNVSISSPGSLLYLENIIESYDFPNLIYRPKTFSEIEGSFYETYEIVSLPRELPEIHFITSHGIQEFRLDMTLTAAGNAAMNANMNVLLTHIPDSRLFGIEFYPAKETAAEQFDQISFLISGKLYRYDDQGETEISFGFDPSFQVNINGSLLLDYNSWQETGYLEILTDVDGDSVYESEKTIQIES